jgi:hypothetical protein
MKNFIFSFSSTTFNQPHVTFALISYTSLTNFDGTWYIVLDQPSVQRF